MFLFFIVVILLLLSSGIVLFLGAWLLRNQLWQWMEGVIALSVATSLLFVVILEINRLLCVGMLDHQYPTYSLWVVLVD